MKGLISRLSNNRFFNKATYIGVVLFLFLYIFSIPAFSGRSGLYVISYFLMALLIAFTTLFTFLFGKFIFNKRIIIPFLFVVYCLLGTAIYSQAYLPSNAKLGWTTLLLMLVTFVTFYYAFVAINNPRFILKIIVSAFISFAIYFSAVYRDVIIHLDISGSRIGDYFDNVNTIGFYFAIAFCLSLYICLFSSKKSDYIYILPGFLSLVLGLFTGSRAFIVSVFSGTIVILFLKFNNHKFLLTFIIVVFLAISYLLIQIPALYRLKDQFDRTLFTLFGIGNSKIDTSTVQRVVWPDYGLYLGGKSLIFGFGVNGFSIYSGIGTYAHNNYAEIFCNFGIVGFILFSACFIFPLLYSIKSVKKDVKAVIVLFFMFFFRNFFGVTYYSKEAYLLLSLMYFLTKDCVSLPFELSSEENKLYYQEVNL